VDGRGRTLPGKKTLELVDGLAAEPSTLCFLNKERLASVVAHVMDDPACPFIGTWPFPVVILDELQAFKSSSSKLFGAMARVRPQVAKIVGLTGTPSPQGLTDLWPELYLLDGGRSLGTSEDTFLTTFFAPHDYDPGRGKKKIRFWDPLPGAHGAVMARIADTCVSVANPNISLPEVTVNDITVAMDAKERDLYDDLFYNWTLTLGVDGQGRPVEVDVVSKTVLSNKLRQMASGALYLGDTVRQNLMTEAMRLSGLNNPNSVAQLTKWLQEETGEELGDLRKDTVVRLLKKDSNSPQVTRMLEIRQELGKTSTKKYDAIEAAVCPDKRVRGLLQFYGANRTGRWAGRLVQVQNLPRTYTEPLALARDLVRQRNLGGLKAVYGSVPDTLSQLIRTAFIAPEGHVLIDADFSAIEARVISWLAGEQWRLEVFRTHGKIYEASASQMFGVPLERIKKGNPEYSLRQKGKVAELALGYQGSTGALINMGALDMGIPEEDLPDIVGRWREANKRIRDLWYSMDNAAVQVITQGGSIGLNGLILSHEYDYNQGTDCMTITLPSGRKLYYNTPGIGENQWGKPSISYMGMDQKTKRWKRIETYGGKLVENCVQAIARDCLADAIERLEAAGLPVVFHVHDEVVIDVAPWTDEDTMLQTVVDIMRRPISWAPDLPLNADGWVGQFFRKD